MESEKKEPRIEIRHYRFVDPAWQKEAVRELVTACVGLSDAPDAQCEDDAIAAIYDLISHDCAVAMVADGPIHYSRGTYKDGTDEVKISQWRPDPVGGETVAAVLIDGVSFCVIEPCVAPDVYSYKRGRQIAEGRLRKRLSELGIQV